MQGRFMLRRFCVVTIKKDRKSTRLNSSHLVISYAVFCLKKKKKVSLDLVASARHGSTTASSAWAISAQGRRSRASTVCEQRASIAFGGSSRRRDNDGHS